MKEIINLVYIDDERDEAISAYLEDGIEMINMMLDIRKLNLMYKKVMKDYWIRQK